MQALHIFEVTKNNYEISQCQLAIGKSYTQLGDYGKAQPYIEKSLQIATKTNNREIVQQNYLALSNLYYNENIFEKALYYHKLSDKIADTLQSLQIKKQIYELETKYETEKKEHELQILSKQNEIQKLQLIRTRFILIGLAVILIVIALLGLLIIHSNKINL